MNGITVKVTVNKMTQTERIEHLFEEWKTAQEQEPDEIWRLTKGGKNITKKHFRKDGIIDENTFLREKRKILFISNEANDDEYSAKTNISPSNLDDYRRYYETGYDDWLGKMRERTSAIYKVVEGIAINEMSDSDAAIHYAVMDLNKRGGGADVKGAEHIEAYCKYYGDYIKKEIEIINPDIVVWLGTKTYDMDLHKRYLGAKSIGTKRYFILNGKQVPILRMWHTSYYQGKITPLPQYTNKIIGKLCAKCVEEMKRYNLM